MKIRAETKNKAKQTSMHTPGLILYYASAVVTQVFWAFDFD